MNLSCFYLGALSFLFIHISDVSSENILALFPMVHKSHYVMFKRLIKELALRGHTIDVVGGIPEITEKSIPGLNFIDFPEIPLDIPNFTINDLRKFTINYAIKFMFTIGANPVCREGFKTDSLKNLRDSNKKYDLILAEIFICDCFFGFAHTFKAPVVSLISSTDLPWGSYRIGNPDNPAYIPVYFQPYKPHLSLKDRVWNTVAYIQTKIGHWWYLREQNEVARNFFGHDMPHLNDIIGNTSLILINSHFSLNLARPSVPNFIEVGGLHIGTPEPLEKEIDNFIGKSKFIYFSLGSLANSETLEPNTLKYMMEIFSELQYKIIWKANETKIMENVQVPKNVLLKTWFPQLDILCHRNIALFITHSGLMGTQEAIHCGVPMLCMPLFADQYQNCQNMVDRGVAKTLEIDKISKEQFKNILREMIENRIYMENVKTLSSQFKDRPMTPLQTAVFWTEYVIRHKGAPEMKTFSKTLHWYQYLLLDVICVSLFCVLLILLGSYVIIKFILRKMKYFKKGNVCEQKKKS